MSKYLLIDFDPIHQPAATDSVERLTWSALRIRVGQQFVSRSYDRLLLCERTNLDIPAFSVARWVVENWWSLFHELCPTESVPKPNARGSQLQWIKRHCLRSADSSLMLPALFLFNDGQDLRAVWEPDATDSMPNMPGEFTAQGATQIDLAATQDSLRHFIDDVLARVANCPNQSVTNLAEQWQAIKSADTEEQQFCTLAGRMGIDPYNPSEMTEDLARFFEQTVTCPEDPLLRDLTEVARPDAIAEQWLWLTKASEELGLKANPLAPTIRVPPRTIPPPQFGYQFAREVRMAAGLSLEAPLKSVEETARAITGKRLRFENRNHVPGQGIRAIVGQASGEIVTVGPLPARADSQRFMAARGLFHALVTTQNSHRLITDAFSWDQKAARAFAAELLAPQQALADRIPASGADSSAINSLSREFNASAMVIEKQLENAGIALSYE